MPKIRIYLLVNEYLALSWIILNIAPLIGLLERTDVFDCMGECMCQMVMV